MAQIFVSTILTILAGATILVMGVILRLVWELFMQGWRVFSYKSWK